MIQILVEEHFKKEAILTSVEYNKMKEFVKGFKKFSDEYEQKMREKQW